MGDIIPYTDIERMGVAIAKSSLFGMETPEQAIALMLIAQAEGRHPALAARDYHVIKGRPTLKADAMLARFLEAGGKVEWHTYTDTEVRATFSHPQGGTITVEWDMRRARQAELGSKDMWKKFPRQMLRARVISEGVRTVFPGIAVGIYTPEEAIDFEDIPPKKSPPAKDVRVEVVEQKEPAATVASPSLPEDISAERERFMQLCRQAQLSEAEIVRFKKHLFDHPPTREELKAINDTFIDRYTEFWRRENETKTATQRDEQN